jgi:hypothetical protein
LGRYFILIDFLGVLALLPPNFIRPVDTDDRFEFVKQKYVNKKCVDPNMPVPLQYVSLFPGQPVAQQSGL